MPRLIFVVYFLLFFFCGCSELKPQSSTPPKPQPPPKFAQYDLVQLAGSDQLGYIQFYEPVVSNRRYKYTIIFRNSRMEYFEEDLMLYRRAEWFVPDSKKAEVEAGDFNHPSQDMCQEPN